jgi:hypothetical protein
MIDGTKIEIAMITTDSWQNKTEKGTFQNWSGYLLYDKKPIAETRGSHCLTPKEGKSQWISLGQKTSKEELELDEKLGEDYGFANVFATKNDKQGIAIKRGSFLMGTITVPLLGWVNEVEIDGKVYKNCVLKCTQELIDKETENGRDYAQKNDREWEDYKPFDKDVDNEAMEEIVEALSLDYEGYPEWYVKFFPSTTRESVKNAAKRQELFAKLLKKNKGKSATKKAINVDEIPW